MMGKRWGKGQSIGVRGKDKEEPFKDPDEGDEGSGVLEATTTTSRTSTTTTTGVEPPAPPDTLLPTPTPTHPSPTPTLSSCKGGGGVSSSPPVGNNAATVTSTTTTLDSSNCSSSSPPPLLKATFAGMDGPPDDKEGFFGHPLTRAEIAINGEAQQDAQREAFLHEYMNLQAWDKQGGRIRDCLAPHTVGSGSSSSAGDAGGDEGVVSSSVVVSDCSMPIGDESSLLDPQNGELSKFDRFDPLLQEDPRVMCQEVIPFPDPAVEIDVTSSSVAKIKAEEIRTTRHVNSPIQKAASFTTTTTTSKGAATRKPSPLQQVHHHHHHPTATLPFRSLRRSESEPCTPLGEKAFTLDDGTLSALAESSFDDPFSAVALVRECEGVGPEQTTFLNGAGARGPGREVLRVNGATPVPATTDCGSSPIGMDAALTTASVVSSSGLLPRGHCVISSSSQPTLRISPAPNNPSPEASSPAPPPPQAKAAGAHGKGRGSKGGQGRGRGGVKEGGGGGGRGKTANKRRHSVPSSPTIITSPSNAGNLPSSASSIFLTSSSSSSSTFLSANTTPPPPSSPAVLSSTLPPEVSASVAAITDSVLTSDVVDPSSVLPSSTSGSQASSVLLLPLAHSALLSVEPPQGTAQTLGVPHQVSHHHHHHHHHAAQSAGTQTPHPPESDTVRQTTKDKLKLRIAAQTAMTQTSEHHQPHPHPQFLNGDIQHHPEVQLTPYPHPYQLQQQQQIHLKVPQQHEATSSDSPEEQALRFLSEDELAAMNLGGKFSEVLPSIKQEDPFLEYDPHYPPPYSSSEASLQVLYNSVSMAASGGGEGHPDLVVSAEARGDSQSAVLSEAETIFNQMSPDSLLVQPQFLHLLQPVDMCQLPQQQHHQQQPTNQHHHHQQQQPPPPSQQNDLGHNGYYNPNDNLYIYTSDAGNTTAPADGGREETLLDMDSEKNALQYMQQQQQQQQQQHVLQEYGYNGNNGYQQYVSTGSVDTTSPDSGIGQDPGLSPDAALLTIKETTESDVTKKEEKSPKRRKSAQNPVLQRQNSSGSDKVLPRNPAIQKLEVNTTGYQYHMDTPTSTTQRLEEDRVTYLNKSQYYPLMLENTRPERVPKGVMCKSVIMLVFREERSQEEESKAWQFWHSRQHSYKQRILDIDTKNSQGVGPNSISELAFNAVSVRWNPREGPVRVNIAVHCLSTDFSNQKGVKGIPLHIQCDTYELFDSSKELLPSHRGYCQIKVFCDKGAERKTRDEERRRNNKVSKQPDTPSLSRRKRSEEAFHPPCDKSDFYSMADLSTSPVYFNPSYITSDCRLQEPHSSVKKEENS
ncbi:hypothetical protein ACOMHN_003433, partial [Nucella lapillus]